MKIRNKILELRKEIIVLEFCQSEVARFLASKNISFDFYINTREVEYYYHRCAIMAIVKINTFSSFLDIGGMFDKDEHTSTRHAIMKVFAVINSEGINPELSRVYKLVKDRYKANLYLESLKNLENDCNF